MAKAKPFIKWAGGKGQLLEQLDAYQVSIPIRRRTSTMKNKSVCVTSALYSVNTKTPIGCSAMLDELLKLKEKIMDALEPIKQKIYEIRGRRVMLDKDLADLYQVTTGNLNKAVKRNIKRFPPDFMFQLTNAEFEELKANLIFQNGTSSWGGTRKLPFAFTREGIAMLSGILRSEVAVQANINIMRAFFQMQEALLIVSNTQLQLEQIRAEIKQLRTDMNDTLADQNEINELTRAQLDAISDALMELQNQGKNPLTLPEIGYTAIQKRREEEEKDK